MSGTFPVTPEPATVNLIGNHPATISISSSGKRQARKTAGHLWRAEFAWPRLPRAEIAPIYAFVNAQQGAFGSFQVVLPNYSSALGSGGSITAGSASAGATSIGSSGGAGGDYIKAGDILKFNNHSKVYMATKDVGSGSTTIDFIPALITAVSGGSITVNNVPFTMFLDGDITEWKGSAPNLARISLKMIEAIG